MGTIDHGSCVAGWRCFSFLLMTLKPRVQSLLSIVDSSRPTSPVGLPRRSFFTFADDSLIMGGRLEVPQLMDMAVRNDYYDED